MKTAETIKNLRKTMGMTQLQFAAAIGSSQVAISEYEKGIKTPSLQVLKAIVKLCKSNNIDINFADIFDDD